MRRYRSAAKYPLSHLAPSLRKESPMTSSTAIPSATTSFVEQLYTRFLHRASDAGGMAYWTGKLDTGALNAAQVSAEFMSSTEFQHAVDPVVRLYFAAFGRVPDVAGLSFWAGAVRAGQTPHQIGAGFTEAPEFQALYGALGNGAFLDALYQTAFRRAPDAAGKAYYLEQISHGLSRSDIVVAFANSPEMRDTMGATARVVEQFLGVQQAAPSAAQVAAGLASADPAALITRLYASDQYHGAAVPLLSRAGVVADGYIKGATVTMTMFETVAGVTSTRVETCITDAKGGFDFGEHAGFGDLVQTGGIDISTGAAVNGSFRAVAGSSVINPLTTLVQAIAADGKHNAVAAEELVKAKLGIDASVELGSYNPIAELAKAGTGADAQAIALKVQAAMAQVNTAMGQIGAVLAGAGVGGTDAGANAAVKAIAAMIGGAAIGVDLGAASTATQLLKDAGGLAGASASQAAAIAAVAADAGAVISNLNDAIADAAGAPGGDAQSHLVAIASVQVAAETIEAGMASGASAGDLSASAGATGGAALATAIAAAAAHVGDVNGDGKGDAVLPPAPEPEPDFAVTLSVGGDAYVNATEATSAAALTAIVTSSSISTVKVFGTRQSDSTALEVTTTLSNGKYVFDATAFKDGSLSVVATDIYGKTRTVSLALDTTAPALAVTSGALTKLAAPVVSGTAEAGATVTAVIAGATYTTAAAGGAWTIDTSTASHTGVLALHVNGSNSISVTAVDAAGNASAAAAAQTLVIDTAAPAVAVTSGVLTKLAAPVVSGTAEAGATVTAIIAGATYTTTATGGAWAIDTSTASHTGVLALDVNGSNSISATAVDAAGNASAAATQTLVIDTTAPAVAVTSGALTDVAAPVVSGTAETGAMVIAVIAGATYTTVAAGAAWSIDTSTASHTGVLALDVNGGNSVSVTAVDAAGNTSTAATQTLVIDSEPPVASSFTVTGTTVGATSSKAGTLGLYDGVSWVPGLSATFGASDLTRTITVAAQDAVVNAKLQVVDLAGHFATDTHDVMLGTASDDAALAGTAGDDFIFGFSGNDTIMGGAGADVLVGGAGADVLDGGDGADVFVFNAIAEVSSDSGPAGIDFVHNFDAASDSVIVNLSGVHAFDGSSNGWGVYNATGGGADTYFVGISANVNSVFTGDPGSLMIQAESNSATWDILSRVQYHLTGTGGADTIVGGGNEDTIDGGAGADVIAGGVGADTLTGGSGADVFVFSSGAESNDTVILTAELYEVHRDVITDFSTGVDQLRFVLAGSHIDVSGFAMVGGFGGGANSLSGVAGDGFYATGEHKIYIDADGDHDVGTTVDYVVESANPIAAADLQFDITGTGGDDSLVGGAGQDTIKGGAGADNMDGGDGADTLSYADVQTTDAHGLQNLSGIVINNTAGTIMASTVAADAGAFLAGGNTEAGTDLLAGSAGYLVLDTIDSTTSMVRDTFTNFENLTGSALADLIYGGSGNELITGAAGNDVIHLGTGVVTVVVGTVSAGGIDAVTGFGADDTIQSATPVIGYQYLGYLSSLTSVSGALASFDGAVGYVYGFELGDGKRYLLINDGGTHYSETDDVVVQLVGTDFSTLTTANFSVAV